MIETSSWTRRKARLVAKTVRPICLFSMPSTMGIGWSKVAADQFATDRTTKGTLGLDAGRRASQAAPSIKRHAGGVAPVELLAEQAAADHDGDHRGDEGVGSRPAGAPVADQQEIHRRGHQRAGDQQIQPCQERRPSPVQMHRCPGAGLDGERRDQQHQAADQVGQAGELHRLQRSHDRAGHDGASGVAEDADGDAGRADDLPDVQGPGGGAWTEQQHDADHAYDHGAELPRAEPLLPRGDGEHQQRDRRQCRADYCCRGRR